MHSSFMICWGAQAAINYFHGVPKYLLPKKAFGVYRHRNLAPASPFLRGFSDDFSVPVSRWTEVRGADLPEGAGLTVLMDSPEMGPSLIEDRTHNGLYMFNHLEYDSDTLGEEYFRDLERGERPAVPHDYFPENNPERRPLNRWRSHAHLLFANWINEIYQTTPFDLSLIGAESDPESTG